MSAEALFDPRKAAGWVAAILDAVPSQALVLLRGLAGHLREVGLAEDEVRLWVEAAAIAGDVHGEDCAVVSAALGNGAAAWRCLMRAAGS